MKAIRAIHFVALLVLAWSILTVDAERIVMPADPLKAKWMSDEETEVLFNKPIPIPEKIAVKLRNYIGALPAAKAKDWLPMKTNLLANPPTLTFASTDPLLRDKNPLLVPILGMIAELDAPVLCFAANFSLAAAHADVRAAQHLLDLARRSDYSPNQAEILRNVFHGFGMDPFHDSAQDIIAMASYSFESEDRTRYQIPVGASAPDFSIHTVAGKTLKLSDYRGKAVLLHFWSTSCSGCLIGFPEFIQFVAEMRKQHDLIVIAVSLDDDLAKLEKAIEKYGLKDFINVCDGGCWGSKPARLYKIRSMPSDVAIKSDGTIAGYQRDSLSDVKP